MASTGLGVFRFGFDRRRRWRLVATEAETAAERRRGSIDSGFSTGRQGGSAQVGGAAGWPTDFGHYTVGRCGLSLPGLPIGRRYAVVHCRHRWSRRGNWGTCALHLTCFFPYSVVVLYARQLLTLKPSITGLETAQSYEPIDPFFILLK